MPLWGGGCPWKQTRRCYTVFSLWSIFMIRISMQISWLELFWAIFPVLCVLRTYLRLGFLQQSGFTTGVLISTNRFLFQLQALWLNNITSIFLLSFKDNAFSYSLFIKDQCCCKYWYFNVLISFHHHQMQFPIFA